MSRLEQNLRAVRARIDAAARAAGRDPSSVALLAVSKTWPAADVRALTPSEAAERIGVDTAAYLRAEMREHYRLRGDGVLDNDACARGTGSILAQFDLQL